MSAALSIGANGYAIPNFSKDGIKQFDPAGWTKTSPEDLFQGALNAQGEPDAASVARDRAVKTHTVFRQGGVIVGAIFRDGQSMFTNKLHGAAGRIIEDANGLPEEMRRNFIAAALMKKVGGLVEERYGETGWAPSRGEIIDRWNK